MSVAAAVLPSIAATLWARRKGSLAASGIAAAWVVGPISGWASHRMAVHLYAFFFLSSRITRVGEAAKRRLEGTEFRVGGGRTAEQVFCNGGVQTLFAMALLKAQGGGRPDDGKQSRLSRALHAAHFWAYACAAGDTWASELGVLSRTAPRLVVAPWRVVPRGTNGGVSGLGLAASAAGGASLGLAQVLYELLALGRERVDYSAVGRGAAAGFAGSMVDSVLGALLQYSGLVRDAASGVERVTNVPIEGSRRICGRALLSNNQVNLLAICATAAAGAALSWHAHAPLEEGEGEEENE